MYATRQPLQRVLERAVPFVVLHGQDEMSLRRSRTSGFTEARGDDGSRIPCPGVADDNGNIIRYLHKSAKCEVPHGIVPNAHSRHDAAEIDGVWRGWG